MLISEVLRILDRQDATTREAVAPVAEPFSSFLPAAGGEPNIPVVRPEPGHEGFEAMSRVLAPSPKNSAAMFSIEQRSYDNFLRALEESKKPRASTILDLFQ